MNKILIIDDSNQVRFFLQSIFESKGFEVAIAVDGRAAIKVFKNFSPDFVLSDIDMPNMNGIELAQYLFKKANVQTTLMTATQIDQIPDSYYESEGVKSIIHKSTFADDLMNVVNKFILQ